MKQGYAAGEPLALFSEPRPFVADELAGVPDGPGAHVVWSSDDELLYVGQTKHLRTRLRQHLSGDREGSILHAKVGRMLDEQLGREATGDDIRKFASTCTFAWQESGNPKALKALIIDELHPRFNEIRPNVPKAAGGSAFPFEQLPSLLEKVLAALKVRDDPEALDEYAPLIEEQIPHVLRTVLPSNLAPRGRTGVGDVADVPWVGIFPHETGGSAKQGVYVVYLFASDGSAVYLSLNQGTENVRGGTAALRKRALDIRAVVGYQSDLLTDVDLVSDNNRPRRYEAGNAWAFRYEPGLVPDAPSLRSDLQRMVDLLGTVTASGLAFNPDLEPVHLVMKWSPERRASALAESKATADTKGAVWWGKFGDPATSSVSDARLDLIRSQLEKGIETHCYLYRKGEVWLTRIVEITANASDVDAERLPGYFRTEDCNLFLLIEDFRELAADWPAAHLVLATNPDPDALVGALGNQTSPIFVFELFQAKLSPALRGGTEPASLPTAEGLSLEWLENETLLERAELEELLDSLNTRRALILAGPPGTSKTWIAKALARYVTQDVPLTYRLLQFHPSYGYEEFIEGLRPVAEAGSIKFQREDGAVLRMANLIEETADQTHVLVLDEMNRANLPRVFGELMYLLEYRTETVDLLYSQDFALPERLLFIGTMNTADRSIRSLDIALRRRFDVFELPPRDSILRRYYEERSNLVPDLIDGFLRLNELLTKARDRHHTIGHSFFMRNPYTHQSLLSTWRRQLRPLIDEYFFDQPDVAATYRVEDLWPSADVSSN